MMHLIQIAGLLLGIISLIAVGYIYGFGHAIKRVNDRRQFQLTREETFVLVGHRLHQLQATAEARRRTEPLSSRPHGRTLMRLDSDEINEYHRLVGQWQRLRPDWYKSFEHRVYGGGSDMGPGWPQFITPAQKH